MFVVTSEEMRRLDRQAIDGLGIPALVLMENAGRALAEEVLDLLREKHGGDRGAIARERWLVLAGKGNNGGDGFVAARHLMEAGVEVVAALAVAAEALTGEARQQAAMAQRFGVPCLDVSAESGKEVPWHLFTGVVDALLGTGTAGAPREPYAALIRAANASGLPIVAADVPSGLDADTGAVYDPCIRAERTVAFAFLKRGLVQYPGAEYAGRVRTVTIGIPARLAAEAGIGVRYITANTVGAALGVDPARRRTADTHKGTYGHVLAVAGSRAMTGAGLLCVKAALRTGCGLATWALPASVLPLAVGLVPEAMLAEVPEAASGGGWAATEAAQLVNMAAERRAAVVVGPGLGRWAGDTAWLRTLWEGVTGPLVLDADALNMLAEAGVSAWPRRAGPAILTPHPGEMARLARTPTADVQQDRVSLARRFAQEHGVTLVLKGARTITATPSGSVYINATGNPGMATGGAGDVLAGIIASLLAQGHSAEQAAAFGVYLHGAAGDRAAAYRGEASLLAGDIIGEL